MTFHFDDDDWFSANRYVGVDADGRRAIENVASNYKMFVEAGIGRPLDRQVRTELEKVAIQAETLFQALQDLSAATRMRLAQSPVEPTYVYPDRFGGTPRKDGMDLLETRTNQIDALKIWITNTLDECSERHNGQDADNFRWLVQQIGNIVEHNSQHKFNRGKTCSDFMINIVANIDSGKTSGQIDGAMKAYRPLGKSAP